MVEISKDKNMFSEIIIVDGQPGCGKTAVSPIVASLDRVEKLTYALPIEHMCGLYYLDKIDLNTASIIIKMFASKQIYYNMMSREINFRLGDVSSIFADINPNKYIERAINKRKDESIPDYIKKMNPILNLTTHNLLPFSEPIFTAFKNNLTFIEVIRHPLYMIKQQSLNMDNWLDSSRNMTIAFKYKNIELPYYVKGFEEEFIEGNSIEKAILCINKLTNLANRSYKHFRKHKIITIPFEKFVINPWSYLKKIARDANTKIIDNTKKMMKRQKIPRKIIFDSLDLEIYRRCGWKPSSEREENEELNYVITNTSEDIFNIFEKLCENYDRRYLKDVEI